MGPEPGSPELAAAAPHCLAVPAVSCTHRLAALTPDPGRAASADFMMENWCKKNPNPVTSELQRKAPSTTHTE